MDVPLEGCSKVWLKVILEHLVANKWFSWDSYEKNVKEFQFKGKDCDNRPPVLPGKTMKIKGSRRIIGTFSEIACLIRSLPQLLFDEIKNTEDPFWKWLLLIRNFLRFVLMPSITESQVILQQIC